MKTMSNGANNNRDTDNDRKLPLDYLEFLNGFVNALFLRTVPLTGLYELNQLISATGCSIRLAITTNQVLQSAKLSKMSTILYFFFVFTFSPENRKISRPPHPPIGIVFNTKKTPLA